MSSENPVPVIFGQYELRELIGSGGMGEVYLAYQSGLKRKVAIKVLNNASASDPHYGARFAREAQMAASLEHPHIVPVYDHGTTPDGISYVVMRLLTGGSLGQRLEQLKTREESLPTLTETASLLRQIAGALDYAHNKGVIHRDIKPNNIMFDEQGNTYLVDFGIARAVVEADHKTLTQTGMMVGTPAYMPPEVWRGQEWAHNSDQYALGIVIYEMVSGTPPFEAPTLYELISLHLHEMPALPPNPYHQVPDAVAPVLQRALSKNPADRYASVMEFSEAFDSAIKDLPVKDEDTTGFFLMPIEGQPNFVISTPRNLLTRSVSTTQMLPTTQVVMSRNSKIAIGAGVALAVIALVVLVVIALQGRSEGQSLQGTLAAIEATRAADPSSVTSDMLTATATVCMATFSPPQNGGSGEIAFHSDRSGNTNLYLMNADGTNVRRLTETEADDMNPVWSPDGSKLAFISTRDGNNEIYLLVSVPEARDSFTLQRLTTNTFDDADPAWSPDSQKLVFASQEEGNWDIFSVNADGTGLQRLTDAPGTDERPIWSPDGKQVAFSSARDGNQEIYVMDADGSNLRRITNSEANDGNSSAWSSDGRYLAFVSILPDGNWEIYMKDMHSDDAPVDFTKLVGDEWQPTWSADGQTLIYLWQTDNVEIMAVNADGSNRRNLTAASTDDWTYSLAPDGQHIAFESDRSGNWEIYTADSCGGDVRRLTNDQTNDYYPAWRPGS